MAGDFYLRSGRSALTEIDSWDMVQGWSNSTNGVFSMSGGILAGTIIFFMVAIVVAFGIPYRYYSQRENR